MIQDSLALGAEFPTPSLEDWTRLVEKSLGGAPFDRKMLTRTYEGFVLKPLYTRADEAATPVAEGLPGFAPFTRGATAPGAAIGGWEICQEVDHPDPAEANRQILHELESGATAISLCLDWVTRCGLDEAYLGDEDALDSGGIFIQTVSDLDRVLEGVYLDVAPVRLSAGNAFEAAALALAAVWEKRGIAGDKALGAFNADPIGEFAHGDPGSKTPERALERLGRLAAYTARTWPKVTTALVDGAVYHNAGASETQMLGAMLATGVAYLRAMEAAGLDPADAARQIVFNVPMDADQFMGIAKLRALRTAWSRLLDLCGVDEDRRVMTVSATTAGRMLTQRDPWVNMLRTTVSTFAAVVGGAQSITVAPFDSAIGLSTDFARRIARNVQILLMEESSLGRVIDPAGGSWYVETLTEDLTTNALSVFKDIENQGGIVPALAGGWLEQTIETVCEDRRAAIASRKQPITGVSEFPNLKEAPVEPVSLDWATLEAAARTRAEAAREQAQAALLALDGASSTVEDVLKALKSGAPLGGVTQALDPRDGSDLTIGLWGFALAEDFETLRDRADAWKAETGAYPAVFLVTLGPVAEHTGRATFARNLFEAGGIEALVSGPLETAEQAVAAWRESGAKAAVLCATDDRYAADAVAVARALKAAGLERLYLAGKPADDARDTFEAAGIDAYVYVGCPVYDVLNELQGLLGVADAVDQGEEA